MKFIEELKEQRWDDHRYYHHSRINQTLHLISAMSFLRAYALIFVNPVMAAFLGWIVAMVTRQIGHFFLSRKVMMKLIRQHMNTRKTLKLKKSPAHQFLLRN